MQPAPTLDEFDHDQEKPETLSPQPTLADFDHVKLLGEGAFAAVYKVVRKADGGTYALKKVKLPSLSDKEKQNAFNEIRLLASVQHENVISYKEAFFDDRTRCLCIVTELADRGDLMEQIVKCQKAHTHIPEDDIWRYLLGLTRALQALHSMDIFHRDLKSANIFLSKGPKGFTPKLGDFNVSTVAKKGLCMTQTGTPYYASPEIWRDTPYDAKSDIWGLGCVLYEAAALKPPFRAEDMEGLYRKVLRGQYKRIPSCYSDDLSNVIGTMLQVNPRHRPSAAQILLLPAVQQREARVLDSRAPADPGASNSNLLSTIKIPRKLVDLYSQLPRPQYSAEDGQIREQQQEQQQKPLQQGLKLKLPPMLKEPPQRQRRGSGSLPPVRQPRRREVRPRRRPPSQEHAPTPLGSGRAPPRPPSKTGATQEGSNALPLLPPLPGQAGVRLPRIASCPGQLD